MIQINIQEVSEMKRYSIKIANPRITKKKCLLYKNFDIPNKEGIYFIFDKKDNLIYIGKSINLQDRIYSHIRSNSNPITNKNELHSVSFIISENYKYSTDGLERIYIDLYKPKYNDIKVYKEPHEIITPEIQRQMTQHIQFQ